MHAQALRFVQIMLLSVLLAAGTAVAAPITTLTVAVITPSLIDAPIVVGIAKGIFEKHGLEIRTRSVPNGFEALRRLIDGTVQIGAAGATAVAQTLGQGVPLRVIAVTNGDATGRVPTDPYLAVVAGKVSGIRAGHLEDLRGKRVGVRRGSDFHQYLLAALAAKGLDAGDVTIVDSADLLGALQGGRADAIVTSEPGASRILLTVGGTLVQRDGNHMQFLELQAASARYLATHPGTITRYLTAFAETAQFVRTHPDETTDIMIHQQLNNVPRDLVRAAVGYLIRDVRISKVTVQGAQAGSEFAVKIGALRQPPTFREMFDPRILRQVEREHPEFFRDLPPIPDALRL